MGERPVCQARLQDKEDGFLLKDATVWALSVLQWPMY
jgi:hypothetical protein